jgi:tetratricopeptide (TPR) repeat protein
MWHQIMNRKGFWTLSAVLLSTIAVSGDARASDDPQVAWDKCVGRNGPIPPDVVIQGCTEVIQAAQVTIVKLAAAFNNRGVAHKMKGEYDQALEDYGQAIRLLPNSAVHYNNRGIVYRLKHDYDRAIADYDEAIWLNSDYPAAYYNRALAYVDKGNYEHALSDLSVVLRFNPQNALALYARGWTCLKNGDAEEGNADIAAAKAINPNVGAEFDASP